MVKKFLFRVDDLQISLDALENLAGLFLKTDVHFHLLHAVPESQLPAGPPASAETGNWDRVQERQAQVVLDKAVGSLLQMGFKRSRLSTESTAQDAITSQDILDIGKYGEITATGLARSYSSGLKRFIPETVNSRMYQYAEVQPVWEIGTLPLKPPHILAAVDESDYADHIAAHLADTLGALPDTRVTLFNVMPAKPPAYWDDGHILDKSERSERQAVVKQWRWRYEEIMGGIFAKARGVLTKAGVAEERISTRMETRMSGIARDILAELSRGGYNILAIGRRGSGMSQADLGSRAARVLRGVRDCSILLVN